MGTALAEDDCQHQAVGQKALGEQVVKTAGQPMPWGRHLSGQTAGALLGIRSRWTVGTSTRLWAGGCVEGAEQV